MYAWENNLHVQPHRKLLSPRLSKRETAVQLFCRCCPDVHDANSNVEPRPRYSTMSRQPDQGPARQGTVTGYFSSGMFFHVLNRGNARAKIFDDEADYSAFQRLLPDTLTHVPIAAAGL